MSDNHGRSMLSWQRDMAGDKDKAGANSEGETGKRASGEAAEKRATCTAPETVLTVLSDPNARTIMRATANEALSVNELVSRCEMSTATAYRKVNRLVEAGLLAEEMCIRPEGTNFREFSLCVDTVHVSLSETGEPVVTLSPKSRQNAATVQPVSTDGGVKETDDETTAKQERLQQLFTEVTGTDEVTEMRDAAIQSRCLDSGSDHSVSKYVTDLARDDGLSETLAEPES